eukprot:474762_1
MEAKYNQYYEQASYYGIEKGQKVLLEHLQSVILYTDFSDLCTAFSSTFRSSYFGEAIQSIKNRNACYYYLSKRLRETVECFGNAGYEDYCVEMEYGPFYCGMHRIMALPTLSI